MRGTRTPDFPGKGPGFDENLKTLKPMADMKKHRCPRKREFQNLSQRWCRISPEVPCCPAALHPQDTCGRAPSMQGAPARACSALQENGSGAPGRTGAILGWVLTLAPAEQQAEQQVRTLCLALHPASGRTCLVFYFFNPLPRYFPLTFWREGKGRGETHGLAACRQRPYGPGAKRNLGTCPAPCNLPGPGLML